jgi:hypothetical protein
MDGIFSRRNFIKGLATLTLFFSFPKTVGAEAIYPYTVQHVGSEYRLIREGRDNTQKHFMSVITQDVNGNILAIRPHPDGGETDDAWGSTIYIQPFLPGATLRNTIIQEPVIDNEADPETNGITISASGKVSKGKTETYGNWSFNMKFAYINDERIESTRTGRYSITLDDRLNSSIGDLNLLKIASNYLDNVPLLNSGVGDTGDMSILNVFMSDRFQRTWVPTQGTTYPSDSSNILTIDLKGNYNDVDTLAQGYTFRIEPAYKPNMKIRLERLTSDTTRTKMILGTAFDETKSQDFSADNVAITPLILKTAPDTTFNYDITFESTPFRYNATKSWRSYE